MGFGVGVYPESTGWFERLDVRREGKGKEESTDFAIGRVKEPMEKCYSYSSFR